MRVAGFLAQSGRAFKADIREDAEHDGLRDGGERSALQRVLLHIQRKAMRLPGDKAHNEDDGHRNGLDGEADARRDADITHRQQPYAKRNDQEDERARQQRRTEGGEDVLQEKSGGGGERHGGEQISRQHRPAGENAPAWPKPARHINEKRTRCRDFGCELADIHANDDERDCCQYVDKPGRRARHARHNRHRDGRGERGRNIGNRLPQRFEKR